VSPLYYSFISSISFIIIPKNVKKALNHPGWRQVMIAKMQVLEQNGTWKLVPLPSRKKTGGCRWVYSVKVNLNGEIDHLKARLVEKGYSQIYELSYSDTFSPWPK